ncbi:immunoglobulin-like domain-containing protein [Domibacillus aminovorans]|uniref:Bacterial Ig-like domain-containing protein n=1 Tax=Domibacillus aminovorans TaxID=29332 RepID=A0A177LCF6_9BACI|nr:immunoglobulin-like domain-containing protein [Domibacillus aminovorans]OAH63066.1 hypothetical protein AWH49_06895 [Domibacillus aminovorans]
MKKHTILISFLTIVSLLLVACQLEPKRSEAKIHGDLPSSKEGITIKLKKEQYTTKDNEVAVTLQNDGKVTFLYGTNFLLEKNVNGTWYSVPLKKGMFFTDEGHLLAPNKTASEAILFEIFSEELSAGNYRIIKNFRDYEKEHSSENQVTVAAPFKLIEP